ncbi:MAG: hypothetical protein ABSD99_07190, partial [Candidatus Bathyarchaeia archaeon]
MRFIAVTVLSILLLTIVGAVSLSPAYAGVITSSFHVSPTAALLNQPVTFYGQVSPPFNSPTTGDSIEVLVWSGTGCVLPDDIRFIPLTVNLAPSTPLPSYTLTGTTDADNAGHYSITVPGGFPAGSYSARFEDLTYLQNNVGIILGCDPFTVSSTPIPEYPFGLAILAVFMIIAYGVIRRKT